MKSFCEKVWSLPRGAAGCRCNIEPLALCQTHSEFSSPKRLSVRSHQRLA